MARTATQLRNALNEARSVYGGQFAGQPRVTRAPDRLEALVAQARSVAKDAKSVDVELAEQAKAQAETWSNELKAIREVQAGGDVALASSSLAQWLRDNFERYNRLFAGQNRSTRDVGILREIIEDVQRRLVEAEGHLAQHDDAELASTRDAAKRNLETYRGEVQSILATRTEGEVSQRAGLLARLANDQFARYRMHFAGKTRLSRRRQVLERIEHTLQEIRGAMVALEAAGANTPEHRKNIQIVDSHLETYAKEIAAIRAARNTSTRSDRVRALAEAANSVFSEYRGEFPGHARSTRDEMRLAQIWEQLWPVALEMADLAREDDTEPVGSNLQKVRDSLRLYEREFQLIRQAKAQ